MDNDQVDISNKNYEDAKKALSLKETPLVKEYLIRYFSDELQSDKSLSGSMERKQLRKRILDWSTQS